jgi:uncharacterized protein YgfB (UPF0149 family)
MPTLNSAYSGFAALLSGSGFTTSPAELHGLLLGRSCAGAGFDVDGWLNEAADLLGEMPQESVRQALVGLQEMVRGELSGEDITVVLLLPGDDLSLKERARALGQWCQGFLSGFGLTQRTRPLSAEADEVLQDLVAIAQIESALEDSEDGENDYMEVMEYLRVAPLLLYAECAAPADPAPKPSLH